MNGRMKRLVALLAVIASDLGFLLLFSAIAMTLATRLFRRTL